MMVSPYLFWVFIQPKISFLIQWNVAALKAVLAHEKVSLVQPVFTHKPFFRNDQEMSFAGNMGIAETFLICRKNLDNAEPAKLRYYKISLEDAEQYGWNIKVKYKTGCVSKNST